MNIETTIENDAGEEITVTGKYWPIYPGKRGSCGEPLEPDEPEEMELIDATNSEGENVDLSKDETGAAMIALWSEFESGKK